MTMNILGTVTTSEGGSTQCLNQSGKWDCSSLFNCCDCGVSEGDAGCGCRYCFSCNACEHCLQEE